MTNGNRKEEELSFVKAVRIYTNDAPELDDVSWQLSPSANGCNSLLQEWPKDA
jgi:hypothetical protein